jgi:hypothetical protein
MTKTNIPRNCEACNREIKTGSVCNPCRLRKCRGELIAGEVCGVCGIDQPRVLRWHRFIDKTVALCANHDALAGKVARPYQAFLAEAMAYHRELTPIAARVGARPQPAAPKPSHLSIVR